MVVLPGTDFLESLRLLFEEAGRNGRDAKLEFTHLRGIIIEFVASCAHMSSAKARANCTFKFADGAESENILALPPSKLDIEESRAELHAAATAEEFIDILRTIINKRKSPRQTAKEKREARKRTNTPPESPKGKVQKRQEAAKPMKEKFTTTPENSPGKAARLRWMHQTLKEKAAESSSSNKNKHIGRTMTESRGNDTPLEDVNSDEPGHMELDSNTLPAPSQSEANNGERQQDTVEPEEGSTSICPKVEQQEDTHMEDMEDIPDDNAENHPVDRRPGVLEVVTAVTDIEPSEWIEFKPKLLSMLDRMQVVPTPEESNEALKRLQVAISHTKPERALIPADTWARYEKKLIGYAKKGYLESAWAERHERIGKVIYLKEEEAAIQGGDWDRLRAAARIWVMLADTTAPPQEPLKPSESDKWLVGRLGDITFLERMYACKKRMEAIKVSGPA
ncbi:Ff.00g023600.m01.CDS01 [Fusarium sp. VM40]|nr:Ff.00g023600.m01.CDS01 [Fusarium sp. VM40]